jgi:peptide/nickel transport system permease protein
MVGVAILLVVAVGALLAPVVAPSDPLKLGSDVLTPPSRAHLFGTDDLGRDVFSRVLYGARITPLAGVVPVLISVALGVPLGLVAGFGRGVVDNVIMRLIDVLLAFPGIVLAIAIVAILGPGLRNAMIAVGIAGVPIFARVVRGMVLVEREKDYVAAARLYGAGPLRLMFREVLPNVAAAVLVLATVGVATAILATAGLSFVGLGAQPPQPEWGAMLSQGRTYITDQWWIAAFPGAAIAATVLAINLLGDGLRDVVDPRS